jgi:hypothetical protein
MERSVGLATLLSFDLDALAKPVASSLVAVPFAVPDLEESDDEALIESHDSLS